MELKKGYKKTDIGEIPESWEVVSAASIGTFRGGNGFPLVFQGDENGDYPFFKVSDMNLEGNETLMSNANNWISEDIRKRLGAKLFPANAIVFAKVGAAVFLERKKRLVRPSCIDNNMAAFVIDQRQAVYDYVHTLFLQRRFGDLVSTTALPALNGRQLGEMLLLLPPLPEQHAIAEALSDVDASIAALSRLIAKKRDLRQGAMQRLLTGHTRLPGFKEHWTTRLIGEFTDCTAGGTPSTKIAGYWGGDIRWMSSGELHQGEVWDVVGRITKQGLGESAAKLIPPNCVLVGLAGQGKTRGTVAINMVELSTNQSIAAIFPNSTFSPKFLFYVLQDRYEELRELSSGDGGRGGLNLKLIRSIRVPFPTLDEQTAIARILSDMDAELAALDARLEKVRALKQAMMQVLLTGRVRLPVRREVELHAKEAAHA